MMNLKILRHLGFLQLHLNLLLEEHFPQFFDLEMEPNIKIHT